MSSLVSLKKEMNVLFSYLYRDAGNFKLFHSIVFSNKLDFTKESVLSEIESSLTDGEFFIPENWKLPRLSFDDYLPAADHEWHQLESIDLTSQTPTDHRDVLEFLKGIKS